uniref:Uncharacterized protein n=1 Tax=Globisporangium ultimum (strain ATCC 200006 / CBS 805.95 / DAOM BR144) TaxID=431595 RepID=K3WR87_GLOUD
MNAQDAAYSDDDFGSEEGEYEGGYEEESHAGVEIKEDPTEPAADVRGLGEEDAGTELKPTDSGATISQTTITDLDRPLEEVNEGSRLGTEDDSTTKVRAADGAVPSSRPGESTPGRQADDAYTPTEAATIPAATTTTTCTGVEDPSELPSSDTEESAETQDVCGAMNATQKVPSMLGRSNTLRSLSVPAVQAPSLVDPRLLVPSNQRSTSVLVPNSQNLSINHQDSGHFRIETRLNVSSPRTKSFTRLPSVEEFESQDTVASSTDSEGEDSETDALDGSRELTLSEDESLSSNGRGSSFRDLIPKVSPVWQSSSQAFLPHLPSVIEVTAEEIAAIENTRDGGRNDAEEEKSEGTSENELAPELIGSAERVDGNETSPRDDTQWISNTGENIGFLPNLIDHTPGPAIASANCMGEENRSEGKRTVIDECVNVLLPNGESAPDSAEQDAGSSYEYDYEEQTTASNSGEDAAVPAKGETVPFLTSDFDDELPPAEENKDDEYEEDNDDYMDVHFEEDNRRETELLLREAQLLIQKQYNQDTVHLSPIKETHNMEPGDTEEVAALIQLIRMGNQEFTDNAEEFEDQYGGDEDFMDGEEDEEEEEFEQYASDGDDVGDDDAIYLTPSSERSDPPSCKETASVEDHQVESVESNIVATAIVDNASTPSDNAEPPVTDTVAQISVVDEAKVLRSEESAADRHEPTATSDRFQQIREIANAEFSTNSKF